MPHFCRSVNWKISNQRICVGVHSEQTQWRHITTSMQHRKIWEKNILVSLIKFVALDNSDMFLQIDTKNQMQYFHELVEFLKWLLISFVADFRKINLSIGHEKKLEISAISCRTSWKILQILPNKTRISSISLKMKLLISLIGSEKKWLLSIDAEKNAQISSIDSRKKFWISSLGRRKKIMSFVKWSQGKTAYFVNHSWIKTSSLLKQFWRKSEFHQSIAKKNFKFC